MQTTDILRYCEITKTTSYIHSILFLQNCEIKFTSYHILKKMKSRQTLDIIKCFSEKIYSEQLFFKYIYYLKCNEESVKQCESNFT